MRLPKVNLKFLKKIWPKKNDATTIDVSISDITAVDVQSPKKSAKPPAPPTEECPICHDPVGIANPEGIVESWTKLHCGHKFGTHCIQTWLEESVNRDQNTNPSCPICRTIAKHPCGHLVSPPPFPPIHLQWRPSPAPTRRRRVRRRLTRRPGHPLRPPPPPKRKVQTVGECKTCAENEAFDSRMRQLAEMRRHTGETTMSSSSRSGIKSIIPGLKRSTHTVRTTIVSMGFDDERTWRGHSVFCGVSPPTRSMPRSPTPTPGHSRRLSI
ncbi:hypothetical protein F5X96DRAFT_488728 [Biscogniauxia mediterranea]|nr:hypothetical protein F5X96DRAFT_488728 [Biscogniauxia mediterranea]